MRVKSKLYSESCLIIVTDVSATRPNSLKSCNGVTFFLSHEL